MIEILTPAELDRAREAGAVVADTLQTLRSRSTVGTSLLEIDRWAREMIEEAGAQSCYVDYAPSFGRGPFGHYVCTSVNDAVLHGLPREYALADGDLLSLDLAVSHGGVVADSALSFVVGESRPPGSTEMIDATERALAAGIAAAGPGAHLGDVSHAIGEVLSAAGYAINTEFGGHGVGSTMHQDPHVSNTAVPAVATGCDRACCSPSSPGSWRTPQSSSPTRTGGRCGARPAAGPRTASTPSPSPRTTRRS